MLESQTVQKSTHDQSSQWRVLDVDDHVMVKNGRNKLPAWVPGTIVEQLGEVTFMVKFPDGTTRKCHINQLCEEEPTSIDHPSPALEDVSDSTEESPVTGEIIPPIMPDLPEESSPLPDSESVSEDSDDPDLVIPLTGTPAPVPESSRAPDRPLEQRPISGDKSNGASTTST